MAEITTDLIYDVLKALRLEIGEVKDDIRDIKGEMKAMRSHLSAVAQDISIIYDVAARHDGRLERIETRLGLIEPAH